MFLANIWTGKFPMQNTAEDGYTFTSPVGVFGRNTLGLTDMAGNVWEWSADWMPNDTGFKTGSRSKMQKGGSCLCAADCVRLNSATVIGSVRADNQRPIPRICMSAFVVQATPPMR